MPVTKGQCSGERGHLPVDGGLHQARRSGGKQRLEDGKRGTAEQQPKSAA